MRLSPSLLLTIGFSCAALAQTPATAPIPADRYELVTGIGKAVAKPMETRAALALLNRAKTPMRFHWTAVPPHTVTATFTSTGDSANSGLGELSETWASPQNWRWTAKLGSFSVTRVAYEGETVEDIKSALLPMRAHMMRNVIFWAAQVISASSTFRSAPVEWNGRPATCLLQSDQATASDTPARRWDEQEYCIDDATSMIQILSFAPGNYTVYGYSRGEMYNNHAMPDRITTYMAGAAVIDAQFHVSDAAPPATPPTAAMRANGVPTTVAEPLLRTLDIPSQSISGPAMPVMVNAQVGPAGEVIVAEVCASADPSLNAKALDLVKKIGFGRSDVLRQHFVQVRFTSVIGATQRREVKAPGPQIAISPYAMERTISFPGQPAPHTETLARRSDGARSMTGSLQLVDASQRVRHLQFPDGRSVDVYEGIKAKVTWPKQDAIEVAYMRATQGPADCREHTSGTFIRHDQLQGVDVDVVIETTRQHRMTLWLAPKLGCETVYVLAEAIQQNGSFRISAETKATRIALGEPDATLFEVAADLAEMKPSEAQRKMLESLNLGGLPEEARASMLKQMQPSGEQADLRYAGKK